jgi:hypothetical protein
VAVRRRALVPAATTLVALVAGFAAAASASPSVEVATAKGALSGSVAAELRPSPASVTGVRAIDARDGTTVATGRVRANGTFRLVLPPAVYLVVVEKTSRRSPTVIGFGRLTLVTAGRTSTVPRVGRGSATSRRTTSGVSAGSATSSTQQRAAGATTLPAVAVRYLTATGPEAVLGRGLSAMLVTDLWGSSCYILVEWEQRNLILQEIRLQQSKWVDPATRVTPKLIQPKYFVEGSLATGGARSSWSIRVREIASGRIVATDSGSAANLVAAAPGIGRRLRRQLEEELCGLPARFSGTFTGENRTAGTNRYTGTISFVRSPGSVGGSVTYRVERVSWRHTFTAETPCRANASTTVTITKPDPRTSTLVISKQPEGARGHRYAITAFFASPNPLTIDIVCNGVSSKQPWVPGAALATSSDEYTTDGRTLVGRYASTGTASTYTWNLRGSG